MARDYFITLGGDEDPDSRLVTIGSPHHPYVVQITVNISGERVEYRRGPDGGPEPVRRKGSEPPSVVSVKVFRLGTEGDMSPRDIGRLPMATYFDAAVTAASEGGDLLGAMEKVRAPRGRPRKGYSIGFYREFADLYRSLVLEGVRHPAQEIARRKRVDANTVHQWVHRARQHGFLDPPRPRKGGRKR